MTIKIWQSYSCNNSSSFRLVARFADADSAKTIATELDGFFKAYAVEMDKIVEANDYTWPDNWPPGAVEFAKKHGFTLGRYPMSWGDEGLVNDEPEIIADENVLVVYHSYCGGFGKEVPAYLKARGATEVEREETHPPVVTVMFPYTGGNKKLDKELKDMFAQISEEGREVEPFVTPWKGRDCYGTAAFYRDAKTVGMTFPLEVRDFDAMREWLTKRDIKKPSIRLCEYADEEKFAAIHGAKCDACQGALELWHPRLRDVDSEQMACTSCGGMYELSTFVAAAKKREKARVKAEKKAREEAAAALEAAEKAKKKKTAAKKKPAAKKPAAKKKPAKKKKR